MPSNDQKPLPVSKEVKSVKVESSKEGDINQTSDSMETEQSRKVKPTTNTTNSVSSTNDLRNSGKNNINKLHRLSRKRERTPSPTPSVPGPKRRANSPTSQTANSTMSDRQQPSNPKSGHPTLKPLSGTNNSLKLPGVVRLVKPEMSSASKVLNEEIQKQQGQENARLRTLIFKEVKKQGKSKLDYSCWKFVYKPTTCIWRILYKYTIVS